jgi:hypothetical protein
MAEGGLAAGSALLILNALQGQPRVWPLYLAAAWMSALAGLQRPSLESLTPRLVEREEIPAAANLAMFRGSLCMIAGPALAGMLIGAWGLASTYAVDLLTYLVSLLCVRMIRTIPPPESAERPSVQSIIAGFRYARSRQELIGTYVVDFVAMVFGMPLALFPAVAQGLGGAAVVGPLYAAPAVGALVASLTSRGSLLSGTSVRTLCSTVWASDSKFRSTRSGSAWSVSALRKHRCRAIRV